MLSVFKTEASHTKHHCHEKIKHKKINFFDRYLKEKPKCECKLNKFFKATAPSLVRSHDTDLLVTLMRVIPAFDDKDPNSILSGLDPPPPRFELV